MELSDEKRVALFLALRFSTDTPSPNKFIYHRDIEEDCFTFWQAAGCPRSRDTWVRACRRAKSAGLLGIVTSEQAPGRRYEVFTFYATPEAILHKIGAGFPGIAHGGRRRALSPAVTFGG